MPSTKTSQNTTMTLAEQRSLLGGTALNLILSVWSMMPQLDAQRRSSSKNQKAMGQVWLCNILMRLQGAGQATSIVQSLLSPRR